MRLVFGAPVKTSRALKAALPKRKALPLFGSDGLSSVAYAPDEIVMMLAVAGVAGIALSPWVALLIAIVLLMVVGTYRFNIADIAARGDFELVSQRLGARPGVVVAASSMVDFALTVAVSAASAASYLVALWPDQPHLHLWVAGAVVLGMTLFSLRGIRFLGRVAHLPWYGFLLVLAVLMLCGLFQDAAGWLGRAESASYTVVAEGQLEHLLTGFGLAMLLARAFSSGAVALTGVSTLSNASRFFQAPRAQNAARTLLLMGLISSVALVAITYLVKQTGALVVADPQRQLRLSEGQVPGEDFQQDPLLFQLAETIFGGGVLPLVLVLATVAVLLIATVTAFTGFPLLASILAQHKYLPMHLDARSSRYVYANAVLLLGLTALALVLVFDADLNALVQMYIVGVFTSMTLTQAAIVRYRWQMLRLTLDTMKRRSLYRKLAVASAGLVATGLALLIIVVTKLGSGAWLTLVLILLLVGAMMKVRRHYGRVDQELQLTFTEQGLAEARALPSRVHALIYVANVRKPLARAVAFARASRPSTIEAVAVKVDEAHTEDLIRSWERLGVPVPFTVLDSPYRENVRPFIDYVRQKRAGSPRDVVVVYLPEYVVDRPWAGLFHRRTVHRIQAALRREPGVVVASVPWQLGREEPSHRQPAQYTPSTYQAQKMRGQDHEDQFAD